jgi:hypothetical protein
MMTIVKRGEGDTAGVGSGSPCSVVICGSLCKCLAGSVHVYERGGTIRPRRLLATLHPDASVLKIAL